MIYVCIHTFVYRKAGIWHGWQMAYVRNFYLLTEVGHQTQGTCWSTLYILG